MNKSNIFNKYNIIDRHLIQRIKQFAMTKNWSSMGNF